jgi:hypothetical protein
MAKKTLTPPEPHRTIIASWDQGWDRTYTRVYQAVCACGWIGTPEPAILHARVQAITHTTGQEDS